MVEQEPVVEWDPVTGLPTEVDQDPEEETAAPAPDFSWAASSAPVQPGDLMPGRLMTLRCTCSTLARRMRR
ncbi:hypothetical protein [Nesterenkonia pannonica]|uniref:hypothetical protein n=1 Tax=Nesterenkonia pannonica TaxID=1548602 RepID=UPI0021647FD0|nr:hypothetical protein [Nesterenkonia pannonica]